MTPRRPARSCAALFAAALLAISASASPIVFTNLDPSSFEFSDTTLGYQWYSGILNLPSGTMIGPSSSIQLSLSLAGNVTTNSFGDYGAGIVVDPFVDPQAEIFGFTYQLLENGNPVGPQLGFDLMNPFSFAVNNVTTGYGSGPGTGITFNGIDVTIYNNSLDESVANFQVFIGANNPNAPVPETAGTLSLGLAGIAAILALRRRARPGAFRL